MTEAKKSPSSETLHDASPASGGKRRFLIAAVFIVAALTAILYFGWMLVQMHMTSAATVAPSSTAVVVQLEQRITAVEQKVQSLESKLDELAARVDKNSSVSTATESPEPQSTPTPPVADASQVARLQSDMTALSAALVAVQTEVKQSSSAATETQQGMQNSLAAAIAFIQLQQAASAGRGFGTELTALRGVAGSGFQESLARLDAYAAKGAPPVGVLRDEFAGLETAASVAIAKGAAQNWQDRLLADLKGVVSIRPLHGATSSGDFSAVEDALASGDLSAALDAVKALPAAAQPVFADWKSKTEARQKIDSALHAIADHFITQTTPASAQDHP